MFLSDGAGQFSWTYGHRQKGRPVVADMNGDGHDDLVGAWGPFSSVPHGLFVFYGDGRGRFTQMSGAPIWAWEFKHFYYQSKSVSVGDVNGDGKPDIAVSFGRIDNWMPSGSYDAKLDVFINRTPGCFAPAIQRPFLAGGRIGRPFRYRITAAGAKPMILDAGPLPAGLSLVGNTICGVPTEEGQTKVTLTAMNTAGYDSAILMITINDGANRPPEITAGPSAAPSPVAVNQPVAFSVAASDPDGETPSFRWSFGDGSTANAQNPTHRFTKPGSHRVVVTVTDGKGGSAWKGVTLVVQE
jgi:hypothetical protein